MLTRRQFLTASALYSLSACSTKSSPTKLGLKRKKVIIIGAGLAGLSAATRLNELGFETLIIEARNRIGGRIHTDHSLGAPVDLGHAFLRSPTNQSLLKRCSLSEQDLLPFDYVNLKLYLNGRSANSNEEQEFQRFFSKLQAGEQDWLNAGGPNPTYLEVLEKLTGIDLLPEVPRLALLFHLAYVETLLGTDASRMSAEFAIDTLQSSKQRVLPKGGLEVLIKALAHGLRIQKSEPVHAVEVLKNGVQVFTAKHSYLADAVVSAVPLGVLQADRIRFTPGMPEEQKHALHQLIPGALCSIGIKFPNKFWDDSYNLIGSCKWGKRPTKNFHTTFKV